jgi:putative ABC transport system permease protein
MLKNYVKIAVRNLFKQKLHSSINIIGLSIGIASCISICLYVGNEWSYDKFHLNADSLYRVFITENPPQRDAFSYVEAPFRLAGALKQTFPEVKHAIRLDVRTDIVRYGDKNFTQRYHLADPEFFRVFTFPLLQGNKDEVLRDIDSAVLTENMAEKIFGQIDPMNKVISIKIGDEFQDFIVRGIAEDVPSNSSIRFDIVIPFDNVHRYISDRALDHWFNVYFETYVQLARPLGASEVEKKLRFVVETHYPERYVDTVSLHLQPITDIHLNPNIPQGFEPSSNPLYIFILLGIAFLVLGVACINFMTLAVGRSIGRSKEVGVRKVLGASKYQLLVQFLGEAIFLSFAALILSIILVGFFLPVFNNITSSGLDLSFGGGTIPFLIVFTLLVGTAAGSYPAFFLSRYQPVQIMKKNPSQGIKGQNLLIRSLITGQFVVSIGLIICTFLMSDQLHYLLNMDIGLNEDQVLVIQNHCAQDQSRQLVERLRNSLKNQPEILGVSGASSTFARDWTTMGYTTDDGTFKQFFQLTVDYDYLETMGIELLEGRNFSKDYSTDANEALIVNEAFVNSFDLDSGIGKSIPGGRFPPHRIIGVVKNFNFESLRDEIRPVIMVLDPATLLRGVNDVSTSYSPAMLNFINVKIKPGNVHASVELLKRTWDKISPGHPFVFSFLDQDIQEQYQDIGLWGRIVSYASLLTILIACLGLFGLSVLSVSRRKREIGIRKVLGASTANITIMLYKDFGFLVVLANVVSWPIAFLAIRRWLQGFAYRVDLDIFKFFLAALIALFIALFSVSLQSIKAARTEPVESIRYE